MPRLPSGAKLRSWHSRQATALAEFADKQERRDGCAKFLVHLRRRQEPAGQTLGRPDEGLWAYASNARRSQIFRRGDGVNLQLKLEELGEETSNFKRAES